MFIVFTGPRSVASHVLIVLGVVAVLVVGASVGLATWQAARQVEDAAADQVTNVARTVASSDEAREALAVGGATPALTAFADRTREATGTDFVVVMTTDGVRFTHPNPDLVGGRFAGSTDAARAGGLVLEEYTGSLGPSTRAVVPVTHEGRVIGLVSVGIARAKVSQALAGMWPQIVLPGLLAAAVAGTGAWLTARQVRRETLGLNAREVARLHDHHDALLHAVREGLVITGTDGRIQVVNDEAARLLSLPPDAAGRPVADLGLSPELADLLTSARHEVDVPHATGARLLLVSSDAVLRDGRRTATLTTLRDRTELESLTGRLSATQGLADALHARSHEAANRLHTVVTLIELGRAMTTTSSPISVVASVARPNSPAARASWSGSRASMTMPACKAVASASVCPVSANSGTAKVSSPSRRASPGYATSRSVRSRIWNPSVPRLALSRSTQRP